MADDLVALILQQELIGDEKITRLGAGINVIELLRFIPASRNPSLGYAPDNSDI